VKILILLFYQTSLT